MKDVYSEYIKNYENPVMKKISNLNKIKRVRDLDEHFTKEEIYVAKMHVKRCSTLLVIKEMQWKITL